MAGRFFLAIYILQIYFFFFQAEDGIRDPELSRGLGDVYKRQIWTWLKKANSLRRYGKQKSDGINGLIQNLGLDGLETENHFDPKNDDLADWFSGSPDWVRRS